MNIHFCGQCKVLPKVRASWQLFISKMCAGKSSVINALLGGRFLEEGILPTTNEISVLKFAEHESDAGTIQNADGFYVSPLSDVDHM